MYLKNLKSRGRDSLIYHLYNTAGTIIDNLVKGFFLENSYLSFFNNNNKEHVFSGTISCFESYS